MQTLRKSTERGFFNHGWLKTYHTFSFSDYFDPNFMGFRSLRVINEDFVAPAEGFDTHPHRDMEIITYVMKGSLAHKDSMGNGSTIEANDIQYMSAGSGVLHSEFNPSKTEEVHLMQIWILPNEKGATPRYAQQNIGRDKKLNTLKLLVSPDGRQGSIAIRQDALLYASILDPKRTLEYKITSGRYAWLHLARGKLKVNDTLLSAGDALSLDAQNLKIENLDQESDLLLFDLN